MLDRKLRELHEEHEKLFVHSDSIQMDPASPKPQPKPVLEHEFLLPVVHIKHKYSDPVKVAMHVKVGGRCSNWHHLHRALLLSAHITLEYQT